jgi:hypothetical protein
MLMRRCEVEMVVVQLYPQLTEKNEWVYGEMRYAAKS